MIRQSFKGTVVNRALLSLHGGSLEITRTVPFRVVINCWAFDWLIVFRFYRIWEEIQAETCWVLVRNYKQDGWYYCSWYAYTGRRNCWVLVRNYKQDGWYYCSWYAYTGRIEELVLVRNCYVKVYNVHLSTIVHLFFNWGSVFKC